MVCYESKKDISLNSRIIYGDSVVGDIHLHQDFPSVFIQSCGDIPRPLHARLCRNVVAVSQKLFSDSFIDELKLFAMGVIGGSLYFLAENTALKYSTASHVQQTSSTDKLGFDLQVLF